MQARTYRYYDFLMAAFVTVLLCANVIGAAKITTIGGFTFGSGVLFFPLSYLFGDILTEVYGYGKSRRVVWTGFVALGFASLMSWVIVEMPPASFFENQPAYEAVFGATPRIVLASLIAYWCGEFMNSFVLSKMKVWMNGRKLWMRTIGSTVVGEAVDSSIFYPIAFLGVWSPEMVLTVAVNNYLMKVMWEVLATPLTYRVVNYLKRKENEDYYDRDTNFTPFSIS